MTNSIDLHIHTTASDGSDTPAQLLEKLRAAGIRTFSVTDHDTIDGTLEMERMVPGDLRFIRGIEFSCICSQGKCHILGYNFDPSDPTLQSALAQGRDLRLHKLDLRLEYMAKRFDFHLTEEEHAWLCSQNSPGKPHLGQILLRRGLAPTLDDAIKTYVNPCKLSGTDRISAEVAIRAITQAGGVPVWAHPLGGEGERRLTREQFEPRLAELMGYGIQGLECHYSRYSREDADFLTAQAAAHGLRVSGGSDYHGKNKANLRLGQLSAELYAIDPAQITVLDVL